MIIPFCFSKDLDFTKLTKDEVQMVASLDDTVSYLIGNDTICTPTVSEVKVVEHKTGLTYSEVLVNFLQTHDLSKVAAEYGANTAADLPVCIAMSIFDNI